MKRFFLSILIVFLTTSLISLVGCNNQKSTKEQPSISKITPKEDYELQERCGKRCDEVFTKGFGKEGFTNDKGDQMLSNYNNHYNKKMNKCFIMIISTSYNSKTKNTVTLKNIFDVNENKDYGSLIRMGKNASTNNCWVLDRKCTSEEEWDLLVKPYMED